MDKSEVPRFYSPPFMLLLYCIVLLHTAKKLCDSQHSTLIYLFLWFVC